MTNAGTKKDGQVYIQITDSSAADPQWMASSNIGVTWFQDGDVDIFLKHPVRGRFVWLRGQHLHLCEVYVFGGKCVCVCVCVCVSECVRACVSA